MRDTINLGDEVKHTITGFTGIVTCKSYWLNGCIRIIVQAKKLQDGKPVEPLAFDVEELKVVKGATPMAQKGTGGPCPDEKRRPAGASRRT